MINTAKILYYRRCSLEYLTFQLYKMTKDGASTVFDLSI